MNKRSLALFGLLLVGGGLACLLVHWYLEHDSQISAPSEKALAKALAQMHPNAPTQSAVIPLAPLDPSQRIRLAVGWLGLPDEARNGQVADLLTAELSGVKGLELVDRQSLGKVLGELELNLSGLVRAKDAVRVGKLLRADWFLLGTRAAVTNGDPILVARIVDTRTGIMRDVGVFPPSGGVSALAGKLAGFVRQCRQGASSPKARTFLAVGTLADVGINSRQAEFPQQMRAYLTSAYAPSGVTILEREQVSTLLQEVRLDLAGLTDAADTSAPQPMQSAFWMLNGFYQSFETSGYEVELVLRVDRAFGRSTSFNFRGQPGEALFNKVKAAIDTTLAQADNTKTVAPTRRSEASQQMEMGRDLLITATGGWSQTLGLAPDMRWQLGGSKRTGGEPDSTKRRGYLLEAVRAFETVLLLEPDNQEAKFQLGVCCCDESLGRSDEGIGYLRELAGLPTGNRWPQSARNSLAAFYRPTDPQEAAHWFNELADHSTNSRQVDISRSQAQDITDNIAREAAVRNGVLPDAQNMAKLEARLFREADDAQAVLLKRKGGVISHSYGLDHFVAAFGTNKAVAARRVAELLPTLREKFPNLAPHLLSAAVNCQVDTNAPLIGEFRKSLTACAEHPENVWVCAHYFESLMYFTYQWCFDQKLYALAIEVMEAKRQASRRLPEIEFTDRDQVRLAFAQMRAERWRDALAVLEAMGDVSVVMQGNGPWGYAWTPVLSARQAVVCREKLGLALPVKTGLTTLSEQCLCLHTPSVFAATPDGLWVAIGAQLLHLGFDLRTNQVVNLPITGDSGITALCLGPEKLWVGTAGEGLAEYDKISGKCRLMTEKDGLLINHISSLCLQERTLWIGFGRNQAGGLGSLDLRTGHLSALTPPLPSDPLAAPAADPADGPPRHAVFGLAIGQPDELWMMVSGRGLCRHRPAQQSWDTVTSSGNGLRLETFGVNGESIIGCFRLDQIRLTIENERRSGDTNRLGTTDRVMTLEEQAQLLADPAMSRRLRGSAFGDSPYRTDLRLRRFGEDNWRKLSDNRTLPSLPNCLLVDGADLWLGGPAYIAVFDLTHGNFRMVHTIPARSVDRIQIGGGYLWAQFDRHLHKALLPAVR